MGHKPSAQTSNERLIVESLNREFARLYADSCVLVDQLTDENLYSASASGLTVSIGESILRSAAEIERTFGGITANLWDDPFEWTLPEHLSSRSKVVQHLREVESLRQRAFTSFEDDSCLSKQVATPAAGTQPLIELLLTTLFKAAEHQVRARLSLKESFRN
jgi:hypothetical protein